MVSRFLALVLPSFFISSMGYFFYSLSSSFLLFLCLLYSPLFLLIVSPSLDAVLTDTMIGMQENVVVDLNGSVPYLQWGREEGVIGGERRRVRRNLMRRGQQ